MCVWLCDAADWVFGWPAGWTAVCHWSCNSAPYLCRAGFSAKLPLHQSYCFTQYSSPMILRSSHVPAECNPVSDVYTLWHLGVCCCPIPFAQHPNQCLITFPNYFFRQSRHSGSLLVMSCMLCFVCIKCSSVSQQLFREVRIMKILNHPNIGKFKQDPAAAG